jgi:membrane dipeptidase
MTGGGAAPRGRPLHPESRYPALFEELVRRGYHDDDLMKIAGRNVLQVMREVKRIGARLRAERPPSKATIEELDRG